MYNISLVVSRVGSNSVGLEGDAGGLFCYIMQRFYIICCIIIRFEWLDYIIFLSYIYSLALLFSISTSSIFIFRYLWVA